MSKNAKALIKIGVVVVAILFFLTCSIFVIDSVGPANPKCYNKFLLSTFHGSYNVEGNPSTYWQVEPKQNKEGERVPTYARYSLTTEDSENVGQIWINISDLKESSLKITIGHGISTLTVAGTVVITAADVRASEDGWFKIYDAAAPGNITKFASKYVWVGFENDVRVREIGFKDVNGKAPETVELRGMSIEDSPLTDVSKLKDQANSVNCVNDEQKFFTK